jgi:hypothetical protein
MNAHANLETQSHTASTPSSTAIVSSYSTRAKSKSLIRHRNWSSKRDSSTSSCANPAFWVLWKVCKPRYQT